MNIEILQGDTVLRRYTHDGRLYAEAPPQGAYKIRLTNTRYTRRLAVVSVDGVNVVTGEDGSVDSPGYVMGPGESLTIPGWRRDGEKVAKFTFQPQEGSYANRTGRGTKNTGIIGVAVFDEKPNPIHNILRSRGGGFNSPSNFGQDFGGPTMDSLAMSDDEASSVYTVNASHQGEPATFTATAASTGVCSLGSRRKQVSTKGKDTKSANPVQLGTGYGKETVFHTETTTFERATPAPVLVVKMQYAVRAQLVKWGVPVYEVPPTPEAFPAGPSVAPPPGWQANR